MRQLPTGKQIDGGTHMKIVSRRILDEQGELQVTLRYGTDNGGTFSRRKKTPPEEVIIRDVNKYRSAGADHAAPQAKGDPLDQMEEDLYDYIDDNGLWPEV